MSSEVRRTRRHRWMLVAVVAGLLTFTTACGSEDSDEGDSSTESAEATFEEYQLAYAKCMREEGIDFPDPAPEGEMSETLEIRDADAMEKADANCEDELGERPVDPNAPDLDSAEAKERFAKFDQCLRDNGIDRPKTTGGAQPAIPSDTDPKIIEECDELSTEGLG